MKFAFRLSLGLLVELIVTSNGFAQPETLGPGGFGGPGGPGGFMGQEREILKQFDQDKNGVLDEQERQAARALLKTQAPRGPRGPGGPGFDPGSMMAKPLLVALDTNKNGKLTAEEVEAGVQQLMATTCPGKRATLDETELAEVLNRILPAPFPFGRRGGGPGGRGPQGALPGAQDPPTPPADRDRPNTVRRGGFGGGFGPGSMLAGSILDRADTNQDGKMTAEELRAASQSIFKSADKDSDGQLAEAEIATGIGTLLPAGPGGFGAREKGTPGPKVAVGDVKTYGDEPLYAANVLRTLFFEFEAADWEAELADFHNTDVEVPATLTVDGKQYPHVGISFRGMSSYGMVPAGSKRSLNVSIDLVDAKQRLLGYKTLNLLNANEDPSFLSTVLYSYIARKHIPAPKANFVKVVINGESWGVYVNVQQFNKEFIAENYQNVKGTRWKVRGSPGGGGGLEYVGDNLEDYKRRYQIKSEDSDKAWKEFITLCKTLNEIPPAKLEAALEPILNIDQTLWFLALDVALINNDGYWVRASDYSIFHEARGRFHIIPHDMNEAFHGAMMMGRGPGRGGPGAGPREPRGRPPGGGPRASGLELDPLIGLDDPSKPLRSKLLAVPSLQARYLEHVREIAEQDLNWEQLRPVIEQYRQLIGGEIEADTRKLTSFAAFESALSDQVEPAAPVQGRQHVSLRSFVDQRRAYLLKATQPTETRSNATP